MKNARAAPPLHEESTRLNKEKARTDAVARGDGWSGGTPRDCYCPAVPSSRVPRPRESPLPGHFHAPRAPLVPQPPMRTAPSPLAVSKAAHVLAPHYPLHTLCTPSAHCSRAPSPPALTRVRPPHTPQDWGANVVFSSRPTSARPQSARGPGGAPAGPGPSMSKVAGKTNQQLEDETEELKRKHRLAPRSGVPSAPCAMPSSHPPNVRPPQIKRSALTSRRRSCRRATQRACRKRI